MEGKGADMMNADSKFSLINLQVQSLLSHDTSGHGMDHVNRVLRLALQFAEKEGANEEIVSLIAMLHDVDDYKLVGPELAGKLSNARNIMTNAGVDPTTQQSVLQAISTMGYSMSLKGIRSATLEGKIVSDADMCDALGANGIIRTYTYSMKNGKPFFDKNIFPRENLSQEQYTGKCSDSSVCHLFEKILKLKGMMLTEAGRAEAAKRHRVIVDFLYQLFEEENAPQWAEYLDKYLQILYH